jgi:hypothetical protein
LNVRYNEGKAWQGMARHGKAWQGMARHGKAWQGKARQGKARQGKGMHGKVVEDNCKIYVESPCFHQRIRVDYSI